MQVNGLKAGDRMLLEDGSVVEVLEPSSDGETVLVKYLEAPFNAGMAGRQARCSDYDIVAYAGQSEMDSAAPPTA